MYDYQLIKLVHRHAEGWQPMVEHPHDPAEIDPERSWDAGARLFRCSGCEAEVAIQPPVDAGTGEAPPGAD